MEHIFIYKTHIQRSNEKVELLYDFVDILSLLSFPLISEKHEIRRKKINNVVKKLHLLFHPFTCVYINVIDFSFNI